MEHAALVLIVAAVAFLAGKVAFGRVVDWTMANSPDPSPRYAGWTNGVISELLPIGVLLFIRHQKRHGRTPGALAWSALVGAVLFSLIAQLAQAVPSVGGWIVAALPPVAFMVLSKMVVSMRPAQQPNELPESESEAANGALPVAALPAVEEPETDTVPQPETRAEPEPQPEPSTSGEELPKSRRPHRVRARSLTSAAKVEKAAKELGVEATPAEIAARAGASESTARRHMPGRVASPPWCAGLGVMIA